MNRLAKESLSELGVSRVATSAEDDLQNILSHCVCAPATDALLFQYVPLFIAATPPDIGLRMSPTGVSSASGFWPEDGVRLHDKRGRTLRTVMRGGFAVTTDERPFSAVKALPAMRAAGISCFRCDCRWLPLPRRRQLEIWDSIRTGRHGFDFYPGNLERGLM